MDQKKFEELYKEHAPEIFRYNMFKLNNRENAEDVTSEAFVRLAESNLKHEDNLRAWLFQVSRNIMFDKYFKKQKLHSELDEEILDNVESMDYKLEDIILEQELVSKVKEEISKLDPISSEVLILKIWDDLTFNEISNIVGISENTAKVKFYRGLEKVKNNLKSKEKSKIKVFTFPIIAAGIAQIAKSSEFTLPVSLFKNILNITLLAMTTTQKSAVGGAGIAGLLSSTTAKIVLAVVGTAAISGMGVLGIASAINSNKSTPSQQPTVQQPEDKPAETIKYKDCNIAKVGFSSKVKENWTCELKTSGGFNILTINTGSLTLMIADTGRDTYCWNMPGQPETCEMKTFHDNSQVKLTEYWLEGKLGEIFGSLKQLKTFHMSVSSNPDVNDMKLSAEDIKNIKTYADSIKVKTVLTTYKNKNYPNFSFSYDKNIWKFEEIVTKHNNAPESTKLILTKDKTKLEMNLVAVYGDGSGYCFNNSYKILKQNYARVKNIVDNKTVYNYYPEIYLKNTPKWKQTVEAFTGIDFSNTAFCRWYSHFELKTLYKNNNPTYPGDYYPGELRIQLSGSDYEKNVTQADKIIETIKYK